MSKFVTVWMVYAINPERTYGYSKSFDNESLAIEDLVYAPDQWDAWVKEQKYEVDEDGHHDCGDEE